MVNENHSINSSTYMPPTLINHFWRLKGTGQIYSGTGFHFQVQLNFLSDNGPHTWLKLETWGLLQGSLFGSVTIVSMMVELSLQLERFVHVCWLHQCSWNSQMHLCNYTIWLPGGFGCNGSVRSSIKVYCVLQKTLRSSGETLGELVMQEEQCLLTKGAFEQKTEKQIFHDISLNCCRRELENMVSCPAPPCSPHKQKSHSPNPDFGLNIAEVTFGSGSRWTKLGAFTRTSAESWPYEGSGGGPHLTPKTEHWISAVGK